jgi:toxin ParE1/3/4
MTDAILSSAARQDLLEAIRWITRDDLNAARALRHSVTKAAITIGEHPGVGRLRPEIVQAPYRCLPLTGFPYVIVYYADRQPPLIVRILHGSRELPEVLRDF